eukprot:Gb_08272 [translate_table: standard]
MEPRTKPHQTTLFFAFSDFVCGDDGGKTLEDSFKWNDIDTILPTVIATCREHYSHELLLLTVMNRCREQLYTDPALLKVLLFALTLPTCPIVAEQFPDIKRTSPDGNLNAADRPSFAISSAAAPAALTNCPPLPSVISMLCIAVPKGISVEVDSSFRSIKIPSQTVQAFLGKEKKHVSECLQAGLSRESSRHTLIQPAFKLQSHTLLPGCDFVLLLPPKDMDETVTSGVQRSFPKNSTREILLAVSSVWAYVASMHKTQIERDTQKYNTIGSSHYWDVGLEYPDLHLSTLAFANLDLSFAPFAHEGISSPKQVSMAGLSSLNSKENYLNENYNT